MSTPMSPLSAANSELSDDDDLLEMLEQDKRRSERLRNKVVNSSSEPPTSSPPPKGRSVFGSAVKSSAKETERKMAAMLRERNRREEEKRKNDVLRAELDENAKRNDKATSQEEKVLADMARAERRNEGENLRRYDKYFCANALFLGAVAWPRAVKHRWDPTDIDLMPLHEAILKAHRNDVALTSNFLFLMKRWCERREPPPQYIGRMLFSRVVYDSSEDNCRRHELQALLAFIRYACVKNEKAKTTPARLSPMREVLRNFGVSIERRVFAYDAVETAPKECLDRRIMECEEIVDVKLQRMFRNLGRAFKIWTELVCVNGDLSSVLGETREKTEHQSEKAVYYHDIALLCVRVLLSPFGSRLGDEVGSLLGTIFNSVEAEEWSDFRKRFVKTVVEYTPRLGLLSDLVIYLLPVDSSRARAVGLDIGYMTMWRWHKGPAECPKIMPIPKNWPVCDDAAEISFDLEDVVVCMEEIPDLVPKADMAWALILGRMLKFLLLEHVVLESRQKGQLARIQVVIKRLKLSTHKLSFGVARESFKCTIDALLSGLRGFVGPQDNGELRLVA